MAGWDDIDNIEKSTVADIPEIDKLCLRVFGTAEGKNGCASLKIPVSFV